MKIRYKGHTIEIDSTSLGFVADIDDGEFGYPTPYPTRQLALLHAKYEIDSTRKIFGMR